MFALTVIKTKSISWQQESIAQEQLEWQGALTAGVSSKLGHGAHQWGKVVGLRRRPGRGSFSRIWSPGWVPAGAAAVSCLTTESASSSFPGLARDPLLTVFCLGLWATQPHFLLASFSLPGESFWCLKKEATELKAGTDPVHSPEERQRAESSGAGLCGGGEGVAIRL